MTAGINRFRLFGILLAGALFLVAQLALPAPASAQRMTPPRQDDPVEMLARDVERARSIRQVKDLQYSLTHYAQFGLVDEIMTLFSETAVIEQVYENRTIRGHDAIRRYWTEKLGGQNGLGAQQLFHQMFMSPTVTLNYDGRGASGRWTELTMRGRWNGRNPTADWSGGMQVNDYIRENGVWKISRIRDYHQLEGSWYDGFFAAHPELPLVPYHFSPLQVGRPVPTEPGDVDRSLRGLTMEQIEAQIDTMNAEDEIRSLQNMYGYYVDQKMWDDVTDLFAADGAMEIAGVGIYVGATSIRRGLERDGPQGLQRGQINDNIQLHTVVEVDPNGYEARVRGTQLGMVTPELGKAFWSVSTFVNRYVKGADGKWRIREMRIFPDVKADYYQGWHLSQVVDTAPTGLLAPDRPSGADQSPQVSAVMPAFLRNPVNGQGVGYPRGFSVVGDDRLVEAPAAHAAPARTGTPAQRMAEARRKLNVAKAYDAIENLSGVFGDYLDDWLWDEFSAIMAEDGTRPQGSGFHVGRNNVYHAMTESHLAPPSASNPRDNIRPHKRIQPVIQVTPDGRRATLRTRLFLYFANDVRAGAFNGGMYPNETLVLEEGVWKYEVGGVIDQTYIGSTSYEDGWARRGLDLPATPPHRDLGRGDDAGEESRYFNSDITRPADIPWSLFTYRRGSNARFPDVKPMWFAYRNPISGRTPQYYCPHILTCFGP